MCKVLIIPKITDKTRKSAEKFISDMGKAMSIHNNDGLGYAAIDKDGNLFGERFHDNSDSWKKDLKEDPIAADLTGSFTKSYTYGKTGKTNSFGTVKKNEMAAITLHTRMATSGREFKNTHPFHYEDSDTSLIHNGVIRNTEDFKFKVSTCDSESILLSYLKAKVNHSPYEGLNSMSDALVGYYACGVFSRDKEGNRVLDIFKGASASLYAIYVEELDSVVFSTSLTDVEEICRINKFTMVSAYDLNEGVFFRYDLSGKLQEKWTFTPSKTYKAQNYSSDKSIKKWSRSSDSGTVIDVSSKKTISPEVIEMMKLPPNIVQLPEYRKA